MKISTIIKRLDAIKAKKGDLYVSVYMGESLVDRIKDMVVLDDLAKLKPHCVALLPSRLEQRKKKKPNNYQPDSQEKTE